MPPSPSSVVSIDAGHLRVSANHKPGPVKDNSDGLDERTRAEDIILGGLGFGEEARIVEISLLEDRFVGKGVWQDGQPFEFESEDELTELDRWAVGIIQAFL